MTSCTIDHETVVCYSTHIWGIMYIVVVVVYWFALVFSFWVHFMQIGHVRRPYLD